MARPGEGFGPIAAALVGHDALDLHAHACIVGHSRLENGNGARLLLVLHDAAEGDPGGIVKADVDELPADAAGVALADPIAGDAVTNALELAELLDVDVDEPGCTRS